MKPLAKKQKTTDANKPKTADNAGQQQKPAKGNLVTSGLKNMGIPGNKGKQA